MNVDAYDGDFMDNGLNPLQSPLRRLWIPNIGLNDVHSIQAERNVVQATRGQAV